MSLFPSQPAIMAILVQGSWFQSLRAEIQLQIVGAGTLRKLKPSQVLFEQGAPSTGLHAVIQGELHVTGMSVDGNDVIMAIVRPSEFTGFLACLDHGPHAYRAIATTETTVLTPRPVAVAEIFESDVATYRLLQAPELSAARKLSHFVIEDLGLPLAQRVAGRLADLGRWAYGPASGPLAALDHVSQEDLAMSVHASRQKVNTILRELSLKGLIEIGYGKIRVLNAVGLENFAREK